MKTRGKGTKSNCFGCGIENTHGLKLKFAVLDGGLVFASFTISKRFEGMDNLIHGGVISTILDEAMSHAIFRTGKKTTATADLYVRYIHPIRTDQKYTVRAWIDSSNRKIFETKAEILDQTGAVQAWAKARFLGIVGATGGHMIEKLED